MHVPLIWSKGEVLENSAYFESIQLIERLHRHFLDVLKVELDKNNIPDINNVQCMILYNIGESEMTVGELTMRGYYLGSNVSYNVKKMVENGYLEQKRSVHDKRSVKVRLSDKGKHLRGIVEDMLKRHQQIIDQSNISTNALVELNEMLRRIERFWESQTQYGDSF